jgi:hypothetical protein
MKIEDFPLNHSLMDALKDEKIQAYYTALLQDA